MKIFQAETAADEQHVRELFWEYLQWANAMVECEFGVSFDIESMLAEDMAHLTQFTPPAGRLLLAEDELRIVGIACLRRLDESVGEIKRMYVRPEARGKGVGRALLQRLLEDGRQIGYQTVRLDSARFMEAAHALYHSAGFREIEPYGGSEIPKEYQSHWIFMERIAP